jgi:hypothetical protein
MEEVAEKRVREYPKIELNKLVSEPLRVMPLRDDEKAIYKLVIADFVDTSRTDMQGKPLQVNPSRLMHHTCKITDPISKQKVLIRNITGYTNVVLPNGEDQRKPVVAKFKFEKGGIQTVDSNQFETYAWMERHNGNRDNPFRDKSKPAVFYRVNSVKKANLELENDYILVDALNYIRNSDLLQLKSMYAGLKEISPASIRDIDATNPATLKKGLFDYTKQNPILAMKASESSEVKFKIAIMEAEHFNVIMFDEGNEDADQNRQWRFVDSNMAKICDIDVAEHKIDGLGKHFKTKEGYQHYLRMANELKRILSPR